MNRDGDTAFLKLPATLDLTAAAGLLDTIRTRLAAEPRLRIDASGVETLTVPCIQILLAARRAGSGISIENPSAAFVSMLADAGLACADLCGPDTAEPDQPPIADPAAGVERGEGAGSPDAHASEPEQPAGPDARATEPDAMPGAENPVTARRILTIDDSKTIRDMLMLTLAGAGFEVLQAVDGRDGLDVLGKEQVDIVITDINMPRMDGFEVIRQMRSNASYNSVPILVLTTESEAQKKNVARVAGATGWLVKPFDPDKLIATINKVLPVAA